jgi:hypothetical protein
MMPLRPEQTLDGRHFSRANQIGGGLINPNNPGGGGIGRHTGGNGGGVGRSHTGGGGDLTGSKYPTGGGVLQPSGSRVFVDGSKVFTRLSTGAIG